MAYWFHRNPLKATKSVPFEEIKKSAKGGKINELITKLKSTRSRLLELVSKHSSNFDEVSAAFLEYLSLVRGLTEAPGEGGGESKLRYVEMFRWTNSLGGRVPSVQSDAYFEMISIMMNVGLWYTKHASHLSDNDDVNIEDAKVIHKCLKQAAGLFLYLKDNVLPKLPAKDEKGVDTDLRVVEAYSQQCQAEAQEVTLARALELKHKPGVVYALATETSKLFAQAEDSLKTLDPSVFKKWATYLKMKSVFYEANAYCFFGQEVLAEEKCGEAIRIMRHAKALYEQSETLCKQYAKVKGAGTIARPERHPFFQKLGPLIRLHLEKAERENGFIYYHKIPEELMKIPEKQVYGLATPNDFSLPPHDPLWTEDLYKSLEVKVHNAGEASGPAVDKSEIAPVLEPDVAPAKVPEPKTESGCVIQ